MHDHPTKALTTLPLPRGPRQNMTERLRGKDLAVLARETARTPMHNATVEIFDPGSSRLRLRQPGRAHRRPDRVRAALPPGGAAGARPARQPGLGGRPGLRARLPRASLGAAPPGLDRPAPRAGRPDHVATAGPHPATLGDVLRRGAGGRPHRPALEVPPDPRRRQLDRRHRTGPARRRPRPASAGARGLGTEPRAAPGRPRARRARRGADRSRRSAIDTARSTAASLRRTAGEHRGPARCRRRSAVEPAHDRRVRRSTLEPVRAAPRRLRADRAQGLPQGPPGARRHRQRRHPGHDHRRDPLLADDPRRGRARRPPAPRAGADERDRRGASSPPRSAARWSATCSTCRSARPSPVVRLHQVSYALQAHSETGKAVAADRIAGVAGFAPTTFHALGSRVAADQRRTTSTW